MTDSSSSDNHYQHKEQRTEEIKHKEKSSKQLNNLKIAFLLSSCYLVSAIVIVLLTRSLSLLSEAGHMIANVGGLALALFAINYTKKPPTPERTYGFFRLEILASLANSTVLIMLSAYILYEGISRLFEPPQIPGTPIIIAASIGLTVNFIGMKLLSSGGAGHSHGHGFDEDKHETTTHSNLANSKLKEIGHTKENNHNHNQQHNKEEQSLNVKAAYLETMSDTLGAAGVLVAGLIILFTKFYLADPIVSIGLSLFMIPRTWSIIKKAIHILMEGSPYNISHEDVKEAILNVRGVTGIFELHIWTITSGMHALSDHVVIMDPARSHEILQEINSILEKKFKISHSTIQLERYHSESNVINQNI